MDAKEIELLARQLGIEIPENFHTDELTDSDLEAVSAGKGRNNTAVASINGGGGRGRGRRR